MFRFLRLIRILLAIFFFVSILMTFVDFAGIFSWIGTKFQLIPALLAGSVGIFFLLVVITGIFGRVYCSILCPLGIFQDLATWISSLFFSQRKKSQRPLNAKSDSAKLRHKTQKGGCRFQSMPNPKKWRIGSFAVILTAFLLGIPLLTLFEPYSIFGRMATHLFLPIYQAGNNLLFWIFRAFGSYRFYYVELSWQSGIAFLTSGASLIVLTFLAVRYGRLYCNSICPVGSFLGLISHFSLLKIRLNPSTCGKCGRCVQVCKASCLDSQQQTVDASRCVVCLNCLTVCPKNSLSFGLGSRRSTNQTDAPKDQTLSEKIHTNQTKPDESKCGEASRQSEENLALELPSTHESLPKSQNNLESVRLRENGKNRESHRTFLFAILTALIAVVVSKKLAQARLSSDGSNSSQSAKIPSEGKTTLKSAPPKSDTPYGLTPFRREHATSPPGSQSQIHLQKHCTGCHLCVSQCPSRVLRPALLEYGLAGFFQPMMDFDQGFCNFDCVKCTEVCPNGALHRLTPDEKHQTQIGQVHFIKENCIVYAQETSCGACSEHCPTQAVMMVPYKGELTIPKIDPELCVGCGACEHVCPARPYRSIYIEGNVEHLESKPIQKAEVQQVEDLDFGF